MTIPSPRSDPSSAPLVVNHNVDHCLVDHNVLPLPLTTTLTLEGGGVTLEYRFPLFTQIQKVNSSLFSQICEVVHKGNSE